MAYRLKWREPVAHELSRIVAREFEKALEDLGGNPPSRSGHAVHSARKSVKKIRAVLRLLKTGLGGDYRLENERLKAIAHQLSALRDMDATTETLESVRDHYRSLVTPPMFAAVHRGLSARKRAAVARLDPRRRLLRVMRELGGLAKPTTRQIRRTGGSDAMRAGVLHGYRRARKALATVRRQPEDVRFHAWRRRVKDHWYHVRLLEGLDAHLHARGQRLKRLETWLGDDHDLVLLRELLLSAPAQFGNEQASTVVLGCLARLQMALRRRALKMGERLFATSPGSFRRSIDGSLGRR